MGWVKTGHSPLTHTHSYNPILPVQVGFEKYEFSAKYKCYLEKSYNKYKYEYYSVQENHPNRRTNIIWFEKKSPEYKYEYKY